MEQVHMDVVKGIISLLAILSILVLVHEWGHFIVAKLFRMRVEDFSLFFGPVIWRIGKRGDTEYNIRAIPLGGFVRIAGMEPDDISGGKPILEAIRHPSFTQQDTLEQILKQLESASMTSIDASKIGGRVRELLHEAVGPQGTLLPERREDLQTMRASPNINADEQRLIDVVLQADARANDTGLYSQKPIYQRALVIFAGPFMSLFFGYLIFCVMGMTIGLPGNKITNQITVMPDGAAREAGLRTGDRIVAINDIPIADEDGKAMVDKIRSSPNIPLRLTIDRDGQLLYVSVMPRPRQIEERGVKKTIGLIGVAPNPIFERRKPLESIQAGTLLTQAYIQGLLQNVFSRRVHETVGGPIAMGQMATAFQRLGIAHLVSMAAMFSIGLGIMNLLPIPILDGGHLLLLGVEKVRRRKLSPREVYRAQLVGLGLLVLIVGFVMYNDIMRTLTGKAFQ
jgi:regulator of sigma E protease